MIEAAFSKVGTSAAPAMELTGTEGVKQAVMANLGVSLVSRSSVTYEEKAGALIVKEIPELELSRQFYLVYHCDKTFTPLAENFIDYLKNAVQSQIIQ